MDQDHALSQEAIDALFQSQGANHPGAARANQARSYDFRRTDRIPKEQIRAIRAVHDTFTRSLASSLSAYLRTYVSVNLISVEQLSFLEFVSTLPSPTCLTTLSMAPFESLGLLEINASLAYPLIEILLGGGKVKPLVVTREMTDIEQKILDGLLVLVPQNLALAWQSVAAVDFSIESHESEPAMLRILAPNEAIIVIGTEIQLGEISGMMNIGIPAAIIKMLRQKFEQQWNIRKTTVTDDESARILALVQQSALEVQAELRGSAVTFGDLLRLQTGDILLLDKTVDAPVELTVNGIPKYEGRVMITERRKAVSLLGPIQPSD
jgi:flagellar motor switch protein FliM